MTAELQPWQRPPFEPGHTLSMRHGAYSPRVVEPKARQLLDELKAADPSWVEEVDTAALSAWATAEARCEVLRAYVDEHGLISPKGKTTPGADLLLRCERQAADFRARLGLDPLSRSRLRRDTAQARVDLAKLWAQDGSPAELSPLHTGANTAEASPSTDSDASEANDDTGREQHAHLDQGERRDSPVHQEPNGHPDERDGEGNCGVDGDVAPPVRIQSHRSTPNGRRSRVHNDEPDEMKHRDDGANEVHAEIDGVSAPGSPGSHPARVS